MDFPIVQCARCFCELVKTGPNTCEPCPSHPDVAPLWNVTEPIGDKGCVCGWKRPLIAVTRTDGELPTESSSVTYACPECGRAHRWRSQKGTFET